MRKNVTAKLIETLSLPTGKRLEVREIYLSSLVLRVSRRGAKVWYVTPRADGMSKYIKIGTYPILSLTDARGKARTLLERRPAEVSRRNHAPGIHLCMGPFPNLWVSFLQEKAG